MVMLKLVLLCRLLNLSDFGLSIILSGTFLNILTCLFFYIPQRYPYFYGVVELVWSDGPESYAGSSSATGRASHARQIKGDDSDKKGYPSPPGWRLGMGLTTSPSK